MDAHSAAMRAILIKRRTAKEVADILIKKGFSEEEAQEAAEYYKKAGYIDNADYARRYARDAAAIGKKGPQRIIRELRERGVEDEFIFAALDETEFDLDALMEKKFGRGRELDLKEKNKIYSHFIYKGFDTGEISRAVARLFGDDDYE